MTDGWHPQRLAHPWFARVADLVIRLADHRGWPTIADLNQLFGPELGRAGVALVESTKSKRSRSKRPIDPAALYEVRIASYGEIPTRPRNAHDLLNTIVWAAFPQSKLALSRVLADIQRQRLSGRDRLPPTRTPEHDRIALVDEGGLVRVGDATWIFGHAIYEHAYAGQLEVRGAAIDLDIPGIEALVPIAARAAIDRVLASADLARIVRTGPGIRVDRPSPNTTHRTLPRL
ncbi:MAG: DUF3025 domain-containing protein [Kofleriaceae bacterium]